jgi:glutathione S-transferase
LWGSELSPFAVKIGAMFAHAGLPYRWLPADGGRLENAYLTAVVGLAKRRGTAIRYPEGSPLDEYPLVPFVVEDRTRVLYDSSAIGVWLDETQRPPTKLLPEHPETRWAARLIDEAFDEFGLYMLHHNRWVVSACENDAGARLAAEWAWTLPPGTRGLFADRFSRRQVRRLPYLFSVAKADSDARAGRSRARTPPSRAGFPPTHALLEEAWLAYLDATESILARRPFLLGGRFTIADASACGQLGGNFIDPTARRALRARAPRTYAWLEGLLRGEPARTDSGKAGDAGSEREERGEVAVDDALTPLLRIVGRTFVPLMQQNEAAYRRHRDAGETLFNEAAFDRGRALYDGELLGRPFRSVAKTFQVRIWRDLVTEFLALGVASRARLEAALGAAIVAA